MTEETFVPKSNINFPFKTASDWMDFDRRHLWHPYSSALHPDPRYLVREADGIWLVLEDGSRIIDGMSSWWCAIHGHRHPAIVGAMQAQLERMPHVMFGGLTHEPAISLAQRLLSRLPSSLGHVFYCDSGSVAVEVAMKMAVQYQIASGENQRAHFAAIRRGYHGDTWKAMSVCDPDTGMHGFFGAALTPQFFLPAPPIAFGSAWSDDPKENGLGALEDLLRMHGKKIAALILEPVVQGAGGMRFYHPKFLQMAHALCKSHGVLLIFDEIATGFGRTGKWFAMEHCQVTPDILCLGKALTGGHISMAVTIASKAVAAGISAGEPGVFMHGPTFMANPLACSAAIASLDLLATGDWQAQVEAIEAQLTVELESARRLPGVEDVRVLGAIGVIELDRQVDMEKAHRLARKTGVYLRPFGRTVYAMPPFIIDPDALSQVSAAMLQLAKRV